MKLENESPPTAGATEPPIASFPRVIFSAFLFLVVWIFVAGLIGSAVSFLFPSPGDTADVGIGFTWRNLPGTVLGFLAAARAWRFMIDDHVARKSRRPQ